MSTGSLLYPCAACGAEAKQPCLDGCPALDMELTGMGADPGSLEDSQSRIMAVINMLPTSSLLADPPDRREFSVEEWASRLADWLEVYLPLLNEDMERLNQSARKAIALQIEKDVVQAFFGRSAA